MNPSIQKLAQLMQARQEQGAPPYVLLLGSSLSLTPTVRRAFAGMEDWKAFWKEMQRTSPTERKALLKKPLDALGLEPGYQAVAQLAEAGYFNLILTLSVDDTLDNALKALKTLPASEYRIWVHGEVTSREIVAALDRPAPRIKVVKLRGDINARKLPLTPKAQFEFPPDLEHAITRWLSRDTIVMGDLPFDDDVQRCLRSGDDALWCVLPDEPTSDNFIMRAKQSRPSGEITAGADAEFNVFFTTLAERLQLWSTSTTASLPARSEHSALGAREELSPFIAGPPITHPRHFFGRERELKRLFSLWKRPPLQNAAVIGPRRSGKTSLLLYMKSITTTPPEQLRAGQRADWLPKPEHYRLIFVDFQDLRLGTREVLLRYLLTCLNLPMPHPCDLERCMDVMSRGLRNPTVVLLDEIGVALQRYSELDDAFWEGLRALATTQVGGNLAFVLAAGESPAKLAHSSGLGSPFFNIFGYTATLGPLTEPEADELIFSSPILFPPDDVDWILAQSGRWPLLLQILCRERLIALEESETDDAWREEGLCQMTPFRHLLEVQ